MLLQSIDVTEFDERLKSQRMFKISLSPCSESLFKLQTFMG